MQGRAMLGGGAVRRAPGAGFVTHRDAEYYVFGRVLQAEPAIVATVGRLLPPRFTVSILAVARCAAMEVRRP
jgi:hypothetical protein